MKHTNGTSVMLMYQKRIDQGGALMGVITARLCLNSSHQRY